MSVLDLHNEARPTVNRKLNYKRAYQYWYALLSNKCLSLFDWTGLPFKQRELELRMQFFGSGYTGVVNSRKLGLIVAHGSGVGITPYPDEWIDYVWACPLDSGTSKIGEGAVICRNNSLLLPTSGIVDHFSHLLAHADLSLQAILINSRSTGYSTAKNDQSKKRIEHFYRAIEDGSTEVVLTEDDLDSMIGSRPIEFITERPTSSAGFNILDYWQASQNILKDFYNTIGISKPTDKRERLITDEVQQEQPLFKFNMEDMLDMRKEAAAELSKVFGLTVSVDYAESLKNAQGGVNNEQP